MRIITDSSVNTAQVSVKTSKSMRDTKAIANRIELSVKTGNDVFIHSYSFGSIHVIVYSDITTYNVFEVLRV